MTCSPVEYHCSSSLSESEALTWGPQEAIVVAKVANISVTPEQFPACLADRSILCIPSVLQHCRWQCVTQLFTDVTRYLKATP